jgi:uncharacterized membrane protein YqhA
VSQQQNAGPVAPNPGAEPTPMNRLLGRVRFLAIIAVAGLLVTTVATFIWSLAKSVKFITELVDGGWSNGGWRDDAKVVDLLGVVDSYLLAVVLLIVVIGLYELFIGELDVPQWLRVDSLDDLKKSIVDILIVFLGVKGVETLVGAKDPMDALAFAGAVAILIVALSFFRIAKAS